MSSKSESYARVLNVQDKSSQDDAITIYKTWNKLYDQDIETIGYTGPMLSARYLHKHLTVLGFSTDSCILDVGAGTGLVAEQLKTHGYSVFDAVDASLEMLELAKKKNIYMNMFCCFVGDGHILPINDKTYDAAVMAGCFAEKHMKCDSLLEMIRVVKSGGVIVNVMREENTRTIKEFTKLRQLCAQWEEQGLWRRLEETLPQDVKYYEDYDALVQVYQVI